MPDQSDLEFWRTALVGAPSVLQLASDRPRPAISSASFAATTASQRTGWPDRSWSELDESARGEILVASVAVAAARYSGQDDIVIAVRWARRALPIRIDLSENPTLGTVLERVHVAMADASQHASLTMTDIARDLSFDHDASHAPLSQLICEVDAAECLVSIEDAAGRLILTDASHADLSIRTIASGEPADLGAAFASDLFDEPTISDFLMRTLIIMQALICTPSTNVASVALLSDREQELHLAAAHGATEPLDDRCVHEVIAQRIAEFPDAPAVSDAHRTVTYRELDNGAHRLAHELRVLGLEPESFVALALPRGPALLTAILAVHRCGCAYVPLEPSYPSERLAFMVSDSGAQYMIATPELALIVPDYDGGLLIIDDWGRPSPSNNDSDSDNERVAAPDAWVPPKDALLDVSPSALAYMIYTSGSTGVPKGVMIEHRALVNLMREMAIRPGLRNGEVMVGVTTPAFDLSIPDLFLALTTGAHLVLASPQVAADPTRLMELLDDVHADVMQATPATWRMLIDAGWNGRPMMRVVCGGEGYTSALALPLASRVAQLWNFYGPTEATVWCTSAHLAFPKDPLPLGKALTNYEVFVGDGQGAPVPVGVAGELMIAGVGLARGYHNRAELTAERFVEINGRRCYRTGDLARIRRDGSFEFLGRIDHQVKLRGFRIELGEIETALAAQANVREVVVIVREDTPGDQRLVGYVVADDTEPDELRRAIALRLPTYMVPSIIVVLDDLPRTPNGKTNRAALPAPAMGPTSLMAFVAPRGVIEQTVADIWVEVLGVERVGILDDFFELGGHSLRITQVVTRVRNAFNVELSLSGMYECPTVEATANAIVLALLADPDLRELLTAAEVSNRQ